MISNILILLVESVGLCRHPFNFIFPTREIVSGGFLVAGATTVAALDVALFAIREQEKGHPYIAASI